MLLSAQSPSFVYRGLRSALLQAVLAPFFPFILERSEPLKTILGVFTTFSIELTRAGQEK